MSPLNLFSFPRAIIHIDGDYFFASCEVARNPELKGKPVITGMERGIVSSLTYEAKAMGVVRGMSLREVKKVCPNVVLLPSDYETYSLYSLRMFEIVRRFTPAVEEYSIDECFADLTGLQRPLNMSYETMAKKIKEALDSELGMTFSVGLAPTKVLAKLGSKWKKPSGLTVIPGHDIHFYLDKTPVEKIWGIGPQTSAFLNKCGIQTALQFAQKDKEWVQERFSKPFYEIWQELRGLVVYDLVTEPKTNYKSISKTRTFTPPSSEKDYVYSQLSKNIENACIKARRYKLAAKRVFFFLKSQDFRYYGFELKFSQPTSAPTTVLNVVKDYFNKVFNNKILYRATGVVLTHLAEDVNPQLDLFGVTLKAEKMSEIFGRTDEIAQRYGKHTLFLGSSLLAMNNIQHDNDRGVLAERKNNLFQGETRRKRLAIPMLGTVI